MKAKMILQGVNVVDIIATAELEDSNLTPPDHVVNVARIAAFSPSTDVSPEVTEFVTHWVTQQVALQEQAMSVLAKLEEFAPSPTPSDLISGNAVWPAWLDTWWGSTLRYQWAGRLGEAIVDALGWLDAQS